MTFLEPVLERLQEDYASKGKAELFAHLNPFLQIDEDSDSQANIAKTLDMSVGAIKVAVHRLRQRYRDLFRQEVASTVVASLLTLNFQTFQKEPMLSARGITKSIATCCETLVMDHKWTMLEMRSSQRVVDCRVTITLSDCFRRA